MTGSASADAPAAAARDKDVRAAEAGRDESKVTAAVVTIAKPAAELYAVWRDFANLAPIMENIESIVVHDAQRSTWTVKAPAGRTVSWDAIVTEDEPGKLIAWESAEGADIRSSGRVEFTDAGDRGSVVRAVIAYDPPAGVVGALIAKLFQREPAIQGRRELRRFKQFIETGEVATSSRTRAHQAEHKAG
jgi:uncharacterized membrane protein